jgi:SAM-dependent methyltransferase
METFNQYANYYDSIYKEKKYSQEVDFLFSVIEKYSVNKVKNILSLGCGTAGHEIILAKKGLEILGIDASEKMLEIASQKSKEENVNIKFKKADVTDFKTEEQFDFSMAMFNIVGYMSENKMMERILKNVSESLKKDGLFVFDCWYGPAVLKSRPENKIKEIEPGLIRKTTQKLDIEKSIIDITFEILENDIVKTTETHKIRFWYFKELEYFLEKNNFKIIKACNFLDLSSKISEDNWNIFFIAQKI